jgi:putative transcriptional regulator
MLLFSIVSYCCTLAICHELIKINDTYTDSELAEKVGIINANLSILKNNKAKAIRFSTLEAICRELQCQPADILEYKE